LGLGEEEMGEGKTGKKEKTEGEEKGKQCKKRIGDTGVKFYVSRVLGSIRVFAASKGGKGSSKRGFQGEGREKGRGTRGMPARLCKILKPGSGPRAEPL